MLVERITAMKKETSVKSQKQVVVPFLLLVYFSLSIGIVCHSYVHSIQAMAMPLKRSERVTKQAPAKPVTGEPKPLVKQESEPDKDLWQKPTDGPYPQIGPNSQLRLQANLAEQKLFIYDREDLIYTMIISSGLADEVNQTPTGHFEIQPIRGESFFNQELDEGALNYVSFKDNGVYLFHSVPVNQALEVNVAEAEKLGTKASHGCIRLSLPDSEWFYATIQAGTPVEITNE